MIKFFHNVNNEIAVTHILTRKMQTFVAALGVTFGIGIFIFLNSLMHGFEIYSNESIFNAVPHLRVYQEATLSQPINNQINGRLPLITNPRISQSSGKISNPYVLMDLLKAQPDVTGVTPNTSVNVFFKNGASEVGGVISGVEVQGHSDMFDLASNIVDGNHLNLKYVQNSLILSVGIAEKLNVRLGDNISVTSAEGVSRIMKVVALMRTGNRNTDNSLAYSSLATAQQLLKEGPGYISDININIKNFEKAGELVEIYRRLTGYEVEDWKTANASAAAANSIRAAMGLAISMSILLVAGFGIYNILNMTIMQKINDIAILKAIGFSGNDVIGIFLRQAILMGLVGVVLGLVLAVLLVRILSKVWVGGDMGYFPIDFYPYYFISGLVFGMLMVFLAGFIPAKKAAHVDPVSIFRR